MNDGVAKGLMLTMKSMKVMKNEIFYCNFKFMPFMVNVSV
jgi:hypothetical protein